MRRTEGRLHWETRLMKGAPRFVLRHTGAARIRYLCVWAPLKSEMFRVQLCSRPILPLETPE